MVVAVMVKEEYKVGGENLYKNHFVILTIQKNAYKLNHTGSKERVAVVQRYGKYKDQN